MKQSIETLTNDAHALLVACRDCLRHGELLNGRATVVYVSGRDVHPLNFDLHYLLRQEVANRSIHRIAFVADGPGTAWRAPFVNQVAACGPVATNRDRLLLPDFLHSRTAMEQFIARHANTLLSLHFIRKQVKEGRLRMLGYLLNPDQQTVEEVFCNGWSINSMATCN
jgi:hypothetical protein